MSGLLSVLRQGAQSLSAQQAYSSTVAHNLNNANTPGFARQRAELAAVSPADQIGNSFIGRGAVLHHDFAKRAGADPNFTAIATPVSEAYLEAEGLSPKFVKYMRNWPGFVEDAA